MRAAIRAFDWASTPLGALDHWPASLRFALRLCEHATVPTAIYWGEDLRLIYNDAWAPALGDRHPGMLGKKAAEVWQEAWPLVAPQFAEVMATGRGITVRDQVLPVMRGGIAREAHWNYSLTPIFDERDRVMGVLNQGVDITKAFLAERRLSFQIALADRLRRIGDPEEVKRVATELLGEHLGAARVGYADVDDSRGTIGVQSDWTRESCVSSLSGHSGILADLGGEALDFLRTGEVMAISDLPAAMPADDNRAATWEAIEVRALITVPLVREGELKALLYVHEPEPRRWKGSELAIARDVAERTWAALERAQAEQGLRDSEDHYRHAVELNPQVSWTAFPDGQLNRVAKRWEEWTGTSGLGDSWANGLHPDDRARSFATWSHSVATGEPYDIEHRVQFRDGSYRWARSRAYPRRDGAGEICLWYGSTEDIHDRKLAEERQRLLLNELNHRVKNTLATVQAIAFQTLKSDVPLAEARASFEARLLALSRAHNLLTGQNWEGASLHQIVRDVADYLSPDRFQLTGEAVWLAPRAALAMALALHELGTNAVKYGALSGEAGSVSISWSFQGDKLKFLWCERGGPAVSQPGRRGFGSRLIEKGLATDLGGAARIMYDPDGLQCAIEASRSAIGAPEPSFG